MKFVTANIEIKKESKNGKNYQSFYRSLFFKSLQQAARQLDAQPDSFRVDLKFKQMLNR